MHPFLSLLSVAASLAASAAASAASTAPLQDVIRQVLAHSPHGSQDWGFATLQAARIAVPFAALCALIAFTIMSTRRVAPARATRRTVAQLVAVAGLGMYLGHVAEFAIFQSAAERASATQIATIIQDPAFDIQTDDRWPAWVVLQGGGHRETQGAQSVWKEGARVVVNAQVVEALFRAVNRSGTPRTTTATAATAATATSVARMSAVEAPLAMTPGTRRSLSTDSPLASGSSLTRNARATHPARPAGHPLGG